MFCVHTQDIVSYSIYNYVVWANNYFDVTVTMQHQVVLVYNNNINYLSQWTEIQ